MGEIFRLDLKRIRSSRAVLFVGALSLLFFFLLGGGMLFQAEEASRLSVGIVDLDQTGRSRAFVGALSKSEALHVTSGTEKELEPLLAEERLTAFFTIPKGFEEKLTEGKPEKALTLTRLKNRKEADLAGDIAAGLLMFEVCLGKANALYDGLGGGLVSRETYRAYAQKLYEREENHYGFDVELLSPEGDAPRTKPDPSLLYKQAVIGILGMVMGFFALFSAGCVCTEKEDGTNERLLAGGFSRGRVYAGHGLAAAVPVFLFCLASGVFLLLSGQGGVLGSEGMLAFLVILFLAGLCYLIVFLLLRLLLRSTVLWQLSGSLLVLFSGALGLAGLFVGDLLNISEFMPNYWCIRMFTAIMLK